MFDKNDKAKKFEGKNIPKPKELSFTVLADLNTKESYSTETAVQVRTDISMMSDSDSSLKDIKEEISAQMQEAYNKIVERLENSTKFTEGLYKQQEGEE